MWWFGLLDLRSLQFGGRPQLPAVDYFVDEQQFQHAARCERMRVDRNGSVLSILVFTPPTQSSRGPSVEELERFQMPGIAMPNFMRRAVAMAKAGVYNLRIHHDRVVVPILRDWGIEQLDGLSVKAQEIQEKLLAFPTELARKAEIFERRAGQATL